MSEYQQGCNLARKDIREDHWSRDMAQRYLAECEAISSACLNGRDDFDRGYMDTIKRYAIGGVL